MQLVDNCSIYVVLILSQVLSASWICGLSIEVLFTEVVLYSSSGMIVTSALIIWKALMCVTGSESPVVVVLSGSMEPGFKRVC